MVKIKITISDDDLDVGVISAQFATNETEVIPVVEEAVEPEIDLGVLDSLTGDERAAMMSSLYDKGISWRNLGKHLGIKGDSARRRVAIWKDKRKGKKAEKVKPKKVEPKKASVPNLTEFEITKAIYGVVVASNASVHFARDISNTIIKSYQEQYEDDAKLKKFISTINQRIERGMNKISLVLGPTKCMVARSRRPDDSGLQLITYSDDMPPWDALWDKLERLV